MTKLRRADFDAIAFDIDGTLANSIPVHLQARLAAFKEMAEATGDDRYLHVPRAIQDEAHKHGSSPYTIIGWTLWRVGIVEGKAEDAASNPKTTALVLKKNELYSKLIAQADPMPGAVDFVHQAAQLWPDKTAIISVSIREAEAVPFLQHNNLLQYFPDERMVCRADVPVDRLKPYPDATLLLLRHMGLSEHPERLLVIEDTPHGIEASRRAGAKVAAVATTHTSAELDSLQGMQHPDIIAESFADLSAMVDPS